ncbi:hypothetical protein CRG98_017974 [Punica granatum]|uniref:DUF7745 domain-containing protein n=2 Tax=Punica granatum TaxID=22663 RepID=A0A2I0JZ43_PUNGR|nr:hypothetical protein CRG98_017974 [Punica granatum]
MDRPAPGLRLEAITPPGQEIMRIRRTFRPVDHAFIQGIIGDVVMLTETPVDWIFLRTAAEFWDPRHAVFNFQGTELAPTIEEYTALIQRPTPTTQGIFVPNPFADHGVRIAWLSDWTLLRALTPSTTSYQRYACHGFLLLIFGTLLFPYAPNLIDGAIAQVVLQVGSTSPQQSHTAPIPRATPTSAPEAESSTQAAMRAELQFIREERDRLRCELVDSRAEVTDYRELQTELAQARARIANLDREMARLSATLDRVQARARRIPHP